MKIQELLEVDAVDLAGGALIGDATRRFIRDQVKTYMANKGQEYLRKRMARQALPGVGLILGMVAAWDRYQERPNDWLGIGLDLASGVAGLGTFLLVFPVQMARDGYHDIIKDLLADRASVAEVPDLAKLTGDLERDLSRNFKLTNTVLDAIRDSIKENMEAARKAFSGNQAIRNADAQRRADAISPEAGAAQAARAAATDRLRRSVNRGSD
jgi:hypothetical protein